MMDVIRAQEAEESVQAQINAVEASIEANDTDHATITNRLDQLDKRILEGDWGGYYEAYRRPLIARVDGLRNRLGQEAPERSDDVWTRPAPRPAYLTRSFTGRISNSGYESQSRPHPNFRSNSTSLSSSVFHLPVRSNNNYELVLKNHGQYGGDCVICLGGFVIGEDNSFTLCGHRFHGPCIRMWARVKRGGNNVPCPICSRNILALPAASMKEAAIEEETKTDPGIENESPSVENGTPLVENEPLTSSQLPTNSETASEAALEQDNKCFCDCFVS